MKLTGLVLDASSKGQCMRSPAFRRAPLPKVRAHSCRHDPSCGAASPASPELSRWRRSTAWLGLTVVSVSAALTLAATPPALAAQTLIEAVNSAAAKAARNQGAGPPRTAVRAADAIQRLTTARGAVDEGDFDLALEQYDSVVKIYGDLALAEYAREGRALLLYQTGRTSDALLALEDQSVSMRGSPEVHASLAALLYVERPNERLRAEQEWEVAGEFDQRYKDVEWVRTAKHWPPKAIAALQKFLALQ